MATPALIRPALTVAAQAVRAPVAMLMTEPAGATCQPILCRDVSLRQADRVDRVLDRIALLLPGFNYSPERPLLHFARAVLWSPLIETVTADGGALGAARRAFLWRRVAETYGGYARDQLDRVAARRRLSASVSISQLGPRVDSQPA